MDILCCELLRLLGDDDVLVIDCRAQDDWEGFELHIPGVLRMSLAELSENGHVLPDDELIVLCGWAQDSSDARRAERLLKLRGRQVKCLEGGIHAWVTLGYPTERHARDQRGAPALPITPS